ncbi:hypothetical protein ACHAXT_006631 [Thalassiosira profunda]
MMPPSLFAITLPLLLLCQLCQSKPSHLSYCPAKVVAFFPRGGSLGGRRKKKGAAAQVVEVETATDDANATDAEEAPFDLQEVSREIRREEVEEIRESQRFLKKQQRRRELDKTWLDKGITAFIEFFENLFSWEVIDV